MIEGLKLHQGEIMNLFKKVLVAGAIALASAGANADFINSDWKVANDNMAFLDTTSGLEYLDLSFTYNNSIQTVLNRLDGDLLGWRMATFDEVQNMISWAQNNAAGHSLTVISGPTSDAVGLHEISSGSGSYTLSGMYNASGGFGGNVAIKGIYNINYSVKNRGVWLVSDGGMTFSSNNDPSINANNPNAPINQVSASVPLPASLGLLAMTLLGFSARRKSK